MFAAELGDMFAAGMSEGGGEPLFPCYEAPMETTLGSWRQEGCISVWRYRKAPKMYDGWHFTADKKGCASLIRLFDILLASASHAHRTVTVADPRTVGADRIFGVHDLRLEVPAKLRFSNDLDGTGPIGLSGDVFTVPLSSEDIATFSGAVKDIADEHADFGVGFGASKTIVTFWWWPKKR